MTSKNYSPEYKWDSVKKFCNFYPEYKEQAQKLIKEKLGFKPAYVASKSVEKCLRRELHELKIGKVSQSQFDKRLHNMIIHIKRYILERTPEQAHLFDPKEAEAPFLDTRDK
ncbi:MAG: hypothetical protein AAF611_17420 [Bacteroidota bacterium]